MGGRNSGLTSRDEEIPEQRRGLALAGTTNTNARLYTSDIADPSLGILLYAFDQTGQVPAGFVGQVVVVGTTVSYTPDTGYFGPDSFTYRAIGLGGQSGAASVAVTVAKPDAPVVTPVSTTTGHGAAVKIPLQVSGLFTTVRLGAAPTHGSAVIVGTELTYTPAGGFSGREAFTVIASGPAHGRMPRARSSPPVSPICMALLRVSPSRRRSMRRANPSTAAATRPTSTTC